MTDPETEVAVEQPEAFEDGRVEQSTEPEPAAPDTERQISPNFQLTFVPRELRIALDDEAERVQLATSRYTVAVLSGLTPEQRAVAYLEGQRRQIIPGKKGSGR